MRNTLSKEQKSGILLLLASKTFERLAFYLIMAILIRYLMDSLKLGEEKVGIYYSVFYSVIGITTLFSGLIGDLRDRMKIVKLYTHVSNNDCFLFHSFTIFILSDKICY